jgi:hypothetical protein
VNPDIGANDAILFPFTFGELARDLQDEAMAYAGVFACWDMGDVATESAAHDWGAAGRLIIYAHGGSGGRHNNHVYADDRGRVEKSTADVAKIISDLRFPAGAGNEIIVWSCHAGHVGGFAHMLTLHLTNEGYTGKRVWGCKAFGGTIDQHHRCLKAATNAGDIPRRATAADADYFIGRPPVARAVPAAASAAGSAAASAAGSAAASAAGSAAAAK